MPEQSQTVTTLQNSDSTNEAKTHSKDHSTIIEKAEHSQTVTTLQNSDCSDEAETGPKDDSTIIEKPEHSQTVTTFTNFQEFLNVFQKIQPLLNDWHSVIEPCKVTLLKLLYTPGPVVSFAITISYSLTVQTYHYGQEVHYFNTPFVANDIKDITLLMAEIALSKAQKVGLNYILTLLEPYGFSFIHEQLKLHASIKDGCRYSYNMLIASTMMFCSSASTYSLIRQFGLLLPHPVTLDSIYCSDDYLTMNTKFNLPYARNIFETLEQENKSVILHLDQLSLLDKKKMMFVFSISWPTKILREVVYIVTPNNKDLESKKLYCLVSSIILNLESIGYKVFCIVTGFSRIVLQAMTKFALDEKLGNSYPHPADQQRQLFHIFDPVLLLKTFLVQWISLSGLEYPNFESHRERYSTVQSIILLQDFHDKKLLDLGLKSNILAILKSFIDRPSMAGFSKIFNNKMRDQLMKLSAKSRDFKHTAEFVHLFTRLWEIIRVTNPPETNLCPLDGFGYPLMASTDFDTNEKIRFLKALVLWCNAFKEWEFTNLNMKQIVELLGHTIQGLLDLTKFCLETLMTDYILLGSFHSALDDQFAKYHINLP
ncbi:uncharacterized protein LOC126740714 [Anthonomus grandis grandis]|uniref:uncharacterized protein LOC126740714 n=1 Tax=Anthonomus grandis grandis TaxID=2921223 RepID=UPI0021664C23|nr:uncharacterized protein LOC126740714 [Anthonomus grandis grandis]